MIMENEHANTLVLCK